MRDELPVMRAFKPRWTKIWSVVALTALAGTLAAYGQTRPDVAEVHVGIGTAAYRAKPAGPYAQLYRPYIEMSALAYTDSELLDRRLCPDAAKFGDPRLKARESAAFQNPEGRRWFDDLRRNGWSCLFGQVGAVGCPPSHECVGGLEFHVWRRADCGEAVIAFRGSDEGDVGDWISNMRWFVRHTLLDQYDQVRAAIPHIIKRVNQFGCRPRRIVATGHSLGGGLAQHVALAHRGIHYVYAFDPSPVVGFFDVPWSQRNVTSETLGIDRVYESGEVLSLPRYLASGLMASTACRPRIRIVRFQTPEVPSRIERHRVGHMTRSLVAQAQGPKVAHLPFGFANARDCDLSGHNPEMN